MGEQEVKRWSNSSVRAHIDAHVFPTYTSEMPYDADKDCFIRGKPGQRYCGDSVLTLGCIAWADGHARHVLGQVGQFNKLIMDKIQDRLNKHTFLQERYLGNGQSAKRINSHFFEYPAVAAMLLREVRYGIVFALHEVIIDPLLR